MSKTYVVIAASFSEFKYHLDEVISKIGKDTKDAKFKKTQASVQFPDGTRIMYVTRRDQVMGLRNWELIKVGRWYELPAEFIDEIEIMAQWQR